MSSSSFNPQTLFLLSISVIELVISLLAINNPALALASGCIVSSQAFLGLTVVSSVLFAHLAYDLSNKSLYRCALWTFLLQLSLITSLQIVRPGTVSNSGIFVASAAGVGILWFTLSYKKNLYPEQQKFVSVSPTKDGNRVVKDASSPVRGRGRSRTPKKKAQ